MRPGAERGSVVMTRPVGSQSLDSMRSSPWTRFWGTQGRRPRSPPAQDRRSSQNRLPRLVRIESRPLAPDPVALPGLKPLAERGCCVMPRPGGPGRLDSFPTSPWTRFWENPRPGARPDRHDGTQSDRQDGSQDAAQDRQGGVRPRQGGARPRHRIVVLRGWIGRPLSLAERRRSRRGVQERHMRPMATERLFGSCVRCATMGD